MSQCVPNWPVPVPPTPSDDVSVFDYSVAELAWKDGELGIGPLESPVAVSHEQPWINPSVSATMPPTMDALVPDMSSNMKRVSDDPIKHYSLEPKKKMKKSHKRITPPALHNQSQRNRRDKINQRMNTLQKLLPNSSKTDTASMLDKVIEHLKQLQSQIDMMSRMNISSMAPNPMNMMLPLAMQQQQQQQQLLQFQMSMMSPTPTPMAMGLSPLILHPTAFMPAAPSSDTLPPFLASHPQVQIPHPMNMEAYSRMMAMYQQLQQSYAPISKG